MKRLLRVLSLFLLVPLLLAPGGVAVAHDELIGSEPADGDTVAADSLETLTLTFSANIAEIGAMVEVTGEDDEQVGSEPRVQGPDVIVDLQEDLAAGRYDVAWRVTSSDGHPISGEFYFEVEAPEEPVAEPTEDATEDAAADATEEATGQTTEEATEQATEDATDDEADETADAPAEEANAEEADGDGSGMPWWVYAAVLAGVGVLGVLLARTWTRGRE